jgi:hypothetical protein
MDTSAKKSKNNCDTEYDTTVGAVEKRYGIDLGARADKKLGYTLKKKGTPHFLRC